MQRECQSSTIFRNFDTKFWMSKHDKHLNKKHQYNIK